ncbi:uncharacterized protein RJT20DRAFT_23607 [Scheffersomyces xylosifermentans]|uniref:uncharacterized protein n=1 Tax=Scheffersomyces xylosifermentans TaxID=1304137 RepID=UPI00315DDE6A
MTSISTEIEINAPPAVVRKHFLNFENHANWNPFFVKVAVYKKKEANAVDIQPGDQLHIDIKPKGKSPMAIYPTVNVNTEEEFSWTGTLIFAWLFSGTHKFEFVPETVAGVVKTKLLHSETFGGILVPLLGWLGLFKNTEISFKEVNEALKSQVEELE